MQASGVSVVHVDGDEQTTGLPVKEVSRPFCYDPLGTSRLAHSAAAPHQVESTPQSTPRVLCSIMIPVSTLFKSMQCNACQNGKGSAPLQSVAVAFREDELPTTRRRYLHR